MKHEAWIKGNILLVEIEGHEKMISEITALRARKAMSRLSECIVDYFPKEVWEQWRAEAIIHLRNTLARKRNEFEGL